MKLSVIITKCHIAWPGDVGWYFTMCTTNRTNESHSSDISSTIKIITLIH